MALQVGKPMPIRYHLCLHLVLPERDTVKWHQCTITKPSLEIMSCFLVQCSQWRSSCAEVVPETPG